MLEGSVAEANARVSDGRGRESIAVAVGGVGEVACAIDSRPRISGRSSWRFSLGAGATESAQGVSPSGVLVLVSLGSALKLSGAGAVPGSGAEAGAAASEGRGRESIAVMV